MTLPYNTVSTPLSRSDVAATARALFEAEPGWRARLQAWRPAICPFERVLPWIPPSATILDIGCGAGLLLGLLARSVPVMHAVGVDSDAEALRRAERVCSRLSGVPFTFLHTRETREWPSSRFDAVLLVDVLHHVPTSAQDAFLTAALDRVTPGGRFVYKDMAASPLWYGLANRAHDLLLARQWIHYIDPAHVCDIAAGHGFAVRHREHVRRKWYAHDLLVFDREAHP